ncbi:MAG: hypothetical protein J7K35_01025 [Syntrophobacterales bacterium]|nr:hypothetical protein [Syntrophobacterales bacterium]
MSYGKDNHLDEDQFLLAVVNKTELPAEAREHLSECPQCREQMENLERELALFGRMAEDFTPRQKKRAFRYVKPRNARSWIWNFRTATGAAIMIVLTVSLIWWSPLSRTTPEVVTGVTFQESDQLMADIDTLVDNALPPIHVYISGESGPEFDEEFMEFVVPIINNNTPTYNSGIKGAILC